MEESARNECLQNRYAESASNTLTSVRKWVKRARGSLNSKRKVEILEKEFGTFGDAGDKGTAAVAVAKARGTEITEKKDKLELRRKLEKMEK